MNLRCQVTAEPKPRFILQFSSFSSVKFNRQRQTRGIEWEISVRTRSMSCRNSGFFSCMAYNLLGSSNVTVTLHLSGLSSFTFLITEQSLKLVQQMLHDIEPCVTSLRLENDWLAPLDKRQLVEWNRTHLYFVQLRSTTFSMLNGLFQHSTLHDTLFNIC